jgi:hypothetical protein
MSPGFEYLQRCSIETGFQVATLEKVSRLGEMASDITRHPLLGQVLALKGGTALSLCFGFPTRLSVDLDYNYVGHPERERMLADRPQVEEAISTLATRHGYTVQRSADAFAGRKLYLLYRSVLGNYDRIEIDLNFLFRTPIAGTEVVSLWQPGQLDQPRVRIVSLPELLVGKLLALLDRSAVRDVWDITHLPRSAAAVLGSDSFRAWLVGMSAVLEHPLQTYSKDRLERTVTTKALLDQLAPTIIANVAPDLVELVNRTWSMVQQFLRLSTNELEYVAALYRGELRADLLFPEDPAAVGRLANHPAVQWKIRNVREHLARKA